MKNSTAIWWVWLVAAGAAAAACSETDSSPSPDNVAGAGGSDDSARPGAGAGAGAGGADGSACVESLNDLCDGKSASGQPNCRTYLRNAEDACEEPATTVHRYPSSCGGMSVSISKGLRVETWHYNELEDLVGVVVTDDSNHCESSATTIYGKVCTATGPVVDVCGEVPWCGPRSLSQFCAGLAADFCPSSPDDILKGKPCRFPSSVTRVTTKCGGTVLEQEYSTHSYAWEFDANRHLIGATLVDDIEQYCEQGGISAGRRYGDLPCEPIEATRETVCADGGAGGEGGVGGSADGSGSGNECGAAAGGQGGTGTGGAG